MDIRRWLFLSDLPQTANLMPLVKHIPASEHRGPNALRLFLAGRECGFKLTTETGKPTPALELMAKIMGVELVAGQDLPPEEKATFGHPGPCLIDQYEGVDRHYYLRGQTLKDRFIAANSAGNFNPWQDNAAWHHRFLRGWDGQVIRYQDPDGKKRKRTCVIVRCAPDWEMTQDVYLGIHRWTYDHHGPDTGKWNWHPAPWPDAYRLLEHNPHLGSVAGEADSGRTVDGLRSATAAGFPPVARLPQGCPEGGPHAHSGD